MHKTASSIRTQTWSTCRVEYQALHYCESRARAKVKSMGRGKLKGKDEGRKGKSMDTVKSTEGKSKKLVKA